MKSTTSFKKLHLLLFIAFLTLGTMNATASSDNEMSSGNGPGFLTTVNDEVPSAPIDGLLTISLLAGACFGVSKLRERKEA